jgi:hypothetical protein
MYALLDDVEFVRTCYDYFKEYDLRGLHEGPSEEGEYRDVRG